MRYFESHSHPDHPLIEDKNGYVQSIRKIGIDKLVIAPISYESNYTAMEYFPEDDYPEVYFAKGLHPKYALNVPMWNGKQIALFEELLAHPRTVAVKTGIDLCKKKLQEEQIKRQYEFLQLFMELAYKHQKPMILHIREAAEEALSFFREHPLQTEAVAHCFVYDESVMRQFWDVGIRYFGIGGMVTRKENVALQEAVKKMPLERILLESDAPFVKVEGETAKVNTSSLALPVVAAKIAELKGMSVEEVVDTTYENAMRFYRMDN